ncbi:phosphoglycolate phosphatase [Candidatus Woesearchaeota archaeon]|nr:phosphoglycolate phosphatase [Candidatus Woesearchaeota archaeon]
MKIYFASQSFYPLIGGVSTYLLNLQKELKKRGHRVVELHLRPSNAPNHEVVEGIEVHRVPKEPLNKKMLKGYDKFKEAIYKECHDIKGSFNHTPIEMEGYDDFLQINEAFGQEVREVLNADPPDLIHIHDFQLIHLYRYVPRGTPLVFTWHIPLSKRISTPLKKYLAKHLNEYDKIVFSSPDYIEAAVAMGLPREKCELIYPLCNTHLFRKKEVLREKVLKKFGIPPRSKVILSVQRIDPKSGHEQLINAMPAVLKVVPSAKLVFVGGKSLSNKISKEREWYRERVEALVRKLKLGRHVLFTGNIDYTELPDLYNAADVVALCSRTEGFGLSITEAMSCGKAVVGTRVGGIPIQIKDNENGFLVEREDVAATAERLVTLLKNDKLRDAFGSKSLELAGMHFRLEAGVDKHIHLYNSLRREKNEGLRLETMDVNDVNAFIADFDRTLTDEPGALKKTTVEMLRKLDMMHILSTGRELHYVKSLVRKFRLWDCVVCENGAVIYFPKSRKTITILSEYMEMARTLLKAKNVKAKYGKVVVSIAQSQRKKAEQYLSKLNKRLNYVVNVDEVMILPKYVNKGQGVKMALDYLGVEPERTVVVGDAENDLDLFRIPGFKVAVANAHPKLKLLADQVTEKPSSEGIREIVEKLLR